MSYPITSIAAALTSRKPTLGRIVARSGDQLICATPGGRRTALAGASGLAIGERIVIRDGLAYRSPAVTTRVMV